MSKTPELTVFHDSDCPVCRAEVGFMRKLDSQQSIQWVDINAPDNPLAVAGITYTDAMKNIHVKDASGRVYQGVDGFMAMWGKLPGYRRLVPVIDRVPGARRFLYFVYGVFSKVRMRVYRERIALHENKPG